MALEVLPYEDWLSVVATNLTGDAGSDKDNKSSRPSWWKDNKQRVAFSTHSKANFAPYTATKHAISGLTKSCALDCRKYDIACGQIDIGDAETAIAHGMLQADGRIEVEPRIDVQHVARAVVYMASLPLDANALFMTVMASKMPYVGRG